MREESGEKEKMVKGRESEEDEKEKMRSWQ